MQNPFEYVWGDLRSRVETTKRIQPFDEKAWIEIIESPLLQEVTDFYGTPMMFHIIRECPLAKNEIIRRKLKRAFYRRNSVWTKGKHALRSKFQEARDFQPA